MSQPYELSLLMNSQNNVKQMDIEQKIIEELVNESNLDRKTELDYPLKWSALKTIIEFLLSKGLVKSAQILTDFMNTSFKYLISKNRKGRLEYLEALKSIQERKMLEQKTQINELMKQ